MNYKASLTLKNKTDKFGNIDAKINIIPPKVIEDFNITITNINIGSSEVSIYFFSPIFLNDFSSVSKIIDRLKDFMLAVWDISIFLDDELYEQTIYVNENDQWREVVFQFELDPISVNYTYINVSDHSQELVKYLSGENNLPFSLVLLKKSTSIKSLRERFVTIITACELGVKEFYKKERPDTQALLENMQSPSIVKMLGDMFFKYFGIKFPKNLRKDLDSFITMRNKYVHSSNESPSSQECFNCYVVVLRTFNFLNKISNSYLFNSIFDEDFKLQDVEINSAKLLMSESIKELVAKGELEFNVGIKISKNYSKLIKGDQKNID